MKQLYFSLYLILVLFWSSPSKAIIARANTLTPIFEACLEANEDTLVIFDVDEVLFVPIDQVLRGAYRSEFYVKIYGPDHKGPGDIFGYVWPVCALELVDPHMLDLYHYLQKHSIKSIGLTAGWAGRVGPLNNLEEIRVKRLQELGLDFCWSFSHIPKIIFTSMENHDHSPLFYQGIIFCCQMPKTLVLESFLQHVSFFPKKIIFVDDIRKNLESMAIFCQEHAIAFHGFHYTAVEDGQKPINQNRADIQLSYLIQHKKWLSDIEVGL